MALLAISTAAETIVAVKHDGKLHYRVNTERRGQAEFLVPLVNEVLAEAGVFFKNLKRIGVVTGPGSFTGLRVGLATAQGFGLGLSIPCVGIDSFTLWRAAARRSGITAPVAIALDTLRDDTFFAAYDALKNHERMLMEPQVATSALVEATLAENPYLGLVGDAYKHLPNHAFVPLSHTAMAEALVDVVQRADPATAPALPLYLRAPDVTIAA